MSSGCRLPTPRRCIQPEFERRRAQAVQRLTAAGAHYVIDSVADLLPVLDLIEGRLARGERPVSTAGRCHEGCCGVGRLDAS